MAAQFSRAKEADPTHANLIKESQVLWWKRRQPCSFLGKDIADCVEQSYDERLAFLGVRLSVTKNNELSEDNDRSGDLIVARMHDEVTSYATARGMSEEALAARVGSTSAHLEALIFAIERNGGTLDAAMDSLFNLNSAMADPTKVKLVECLGVKVYQDPQPAGHPPSAAECKRIQEQAGIEP